MGLIINDNSQFQGLLINDNSQFSGLLINDDSQFSGLLINDNSQMSEFGDDNSWNMNLPAGGGVLAPADGTAQAAPFLPGSPEYSADGPSTLDPLALPAGQMVTGTLNTPASGGVVAASNPAVSAPAAAATAKNSKMMLGLAAAAGLGLFFLNRKK